MRDDLFDNYSFKHFSKNKIKKITEKYELLTHDNLKRRFEKLLKNTLLYNDKGARDRAVILYLNADDHVKNELDEISKEIIEKEMSELVNTFYSRDKKDEDEIKPDKQVPNDLNIDDLKINEEKIKEIQEYFIYLGKKRLKIGLFFLIIGILIPVVTYLFSWYFGWSMISWGMLIFGLVMIVMSANPKSNAKKLSKTNLSKDELNRILKDYYKDDFDEKF